MPHLYFSRLMSSRCVPSPLVPSPSSHLDDLLNHLLDNLVEEELGKGLLDLLLDVPVRRDIGDVGSVGGASPLGEHSEDTSVPVEDDRARVAGGGERTVHVAVRKDSDFYRRLLDTVLIVDASERLHSRDATDGGAGCQTVLDDEKARFSVGVEMLGVVDLVGLDDAERLEKTVLRVLVVRLILRLGKHNLAVVQRREIASYGGIKTSRRYRPRWKTYQHKLYCP